MLLKISIEKNATGYKVVAYSERRYIVIRSVFVRPCYKTFSSKRGPRRPGLSFKPVCPSH